MTRVSTSECASIISKLVAQLELATSIERTPDDYDREDAAVIEEAKAMLERIRHE